MLTPRYGAPNPSRCHGQVGSLAGPCCFFVVEANVIVFVQRYWLLETWWVLRIVTVPLLCCDRELAGEEL